jgi:hypothetical protein
MRQIYRNAFLLRRIVEPEKRKWNGSTYPVRVYHRFEIKGGLSIREAMMRDMIRPNPLFKMLKVKADD